MPVVKLSPAEQDRLLGLFLRDCPDVSDKMNEIKRNLMVNNTPAVARHWLEEEGLTDEQLASH